MDLSKLTMGDRITLGTGIVLLISLLALPWHNIEFLGFSETRTALQSPNSFYGVLALLLTIAVIAVIVVTRFTSAEIPELPVPLSQAVFIGAAVALGLLVLKLIVETDFLGYGAWLSLLLAAGMTYGAFTRQNETSPA